MSIKSVYQEQIVQILLMQANINVNDTIAIYNLFIYQYYKILIMVLQHQHFDINQIIYNGMNLLNLAVNTNDEQLVTLLLNYEYQDSMVYMSNESIQDIVSTIESCHFRHIDLYHKYYRSKIRLSPTTRYGQLPINNDIKDKKNIINISNPIFDIIIGNKLSLLKIFLSHPYFDINLPIDDNITILGYSINSNNNEMFDLIIYQTGVIDSLDQEDKIYSRNITPRKKINANICYTNFNGKYSNALTDACYRNSPYMIQKLLNIPDINVDEIFNHNINLLENNRNIYEKISILDFFYQRYKEHNDIDSLTIIKLLLINDNVIIDDDIILNIFKNEEVWFLSLILQYHNKEKIKLLPLINYCVEYKKINMLRYLINEDTNPNISDDFIDKPLYMAIKTNDIGIFETLLKHPNINKSHSLHIACQYSYDITNILLQDNDINIVNDKNLTPLEVAIVNSRLDIVRLLLSDIRIDVNICDPLIMAASRDNHDICKILLDKYPILLNRENGRQITPLCNAIIHGMSKNVYLFLAHSEIDINKACPLYYAVANNRIHFVRKLLQYPNIDINRFNPEGKTSLNIGCRLGKTDIIVELLKNQNLDINRRNMVSGSFPLYKACKYNNTKIVQLLLDRTDLDINQLHENHGETTLTLSLDIGDQNININNMLLGHSNIDLLRQGPEGQNFFNNVLCDKHIETLESVIKFSIKNKIDIAHLLWDGLWRSCENNYDIVRVIFNFLIKKSFVFRMSKVSECFTFAYRNFNIKLVRYFIRKFKNNLDINHIYNKHNILTWACANDNMTLLKIALGSKDIDLKLNYPLVHAVNGSSHSIVKYLLVHPKFVLNSKLFITVNKINSSDNTVLLNKDLVIMYNKNKDIIPKWKDELDLSKNAFYYIIVKAYEDGFVVSKNEKITKFLYIVSKLVYDLQLFICNISDYKYKYSINYKDQIYYREKLFLKFFK